jgi:hypothetical protein
MVAIATVTSSSFGQPPRSCLCIGLRSTFAIALAARFPGFGAGDRPLRRHADRHTARDAITEPEGTEETTGNGSTRQIEEIPSIISIKGALIIVITLTRGSQNLKTLGDS